jgi:2-phosphosulfolactate phosphatase
MPIAVHLAPTSIHAEGLEGSTTIVVDLLRASTTITNALAAGASSVVPCEEIDEVHALKSRYPADAIITGGERQGLPIPSLDLGNGPHEYTRERVAGKTVLFTTTNGTRAIRLANRARDVLVGCFLNLEAVAGLAAHLATSRQAAPSVGTGSVHVLCAGIRGQPCLEDTLCAGAIVQRLAHHLEEPIVDDEAAIALAAWRTLASDHAALVEALGASRGGRNLQAIGLAAQIAECAALNTLDIVPVRTERGALIARALTRI